MLHVHGDKKIKTCPVCQKSIKAIEKAGKELDRLGVWSVPKKVEKGIDYEIWRAK